MSIWTNLFGGRAAERKSASMATATSWFDLLGVASPLGIAVAGAAALKHPTFAGATRLLSEAVALLPVKVIEVAADGTRTASRDRRMRLFDHASAWLTWQELARALVVDAILYGRGAALVIRANGEVRELLRLPPGSFAIEHPDGNDLAEPDIVINLAGGGIQRLRRAEVVLLLGPFGRPLPDILADALAIGIAMQGHAASLFAKATRPGGLLIPKVGLSDDARRRLKEAFEAWGSGPGNTGKTLLGEPGMTFEQLAFSSVDSQFAELWRHNVLEICRTMRVSPFDLGALERATYGNFESAGRSFVAYSLLPWVRALEGALELALFDDDERVRFEIELDLSIFERADSVQRMEAQARAVNSGLRSPNELRSLDGLPAYEGGDRFFMQGATQPIDHLGAKPAATVTQP